jgi:hypothetical protein
MRQNAEVPIKKPKDPYSPPRLTSYGDLTQMTQKMFNGMGNLDGGKSSRKT